MSKSDLIPTINSFLTLIYHRIILDLLGQNKDKKATKDLDIEAGEKEELLEEKDETKKETSDENELEEIKITEGMYVF